jgi:hypothetical protein
MLVFYPTPALFLYAMISMMEAHLLGFIHKDIAISHLSGYPFKVHSYGQSIS